RPLLGLRTVLALRRAEQGGRARRRLTQEKTGASGATGRRTEHSKGRTLVRRSRFMRDAHPELRAIFCAALDRSTPRERADFLKEACQGKPELRLRVEALLQAHGEASGFLQEPSEKPVSLVGGSPATERPRTVIGPYKLMELIGEGGM